jgi:DNA polymerase-3 subunit delta'
MMPLVGHRAAQAAFAAALARDSLHHAWLFVGPAGVGKAMFARQEAARLLATSASDQPAGGDPAERTRALIEAGSHPDYRVLARLPKDPDKPDQDIARSISIAQVRGLQSMFATRPSMGERRIVIIDAADDLERGGANALLKRLEEPPEGTVFLLISHAPGRLLPTIRSRCRLLRFEALTDSDMKTVLAEALSDASPSDLDALVAAGEGSPGRALRYAGLDIAGIDAALAGIATDGDRDNARRIKLGRALAVKAAAPRYQAFLERAPALIAREARQRSGAPLKVALDAHAAARDLAGAALGLSLDAHATVFEMSAIVARLHAS